MLFEIQQQEFATVKGLRSRGGLIARVRHDLGRVYLISQKHVINRTCVLHVFGTDKRGRKKKPRFHDVAISIPAVLSSVTFVSPLCKSIRARA